MVRKIQSPPGVPLQPQEVEPLSLCMGGEAREEGKQTTAGRTQESNAQGVTLKCLCAWGQDKGWQLSDGASAFVRPGRSPGVGRTHSVTQPLTLSLLFLPRTWTPFSEAGQEAARGC